MLSLKQTIKRVSNAKLIHPVDFINKKNTCYANSILRAISLNMALKKNSTKTVDPSNFLWALKHKLSIIRGAPFDFNTQQDVTEILQVVLNEVKGIPIAASHLIYTKKISFL